MCSILYVFFVVTFMLMRKKLVSKVDILTRWEYTKRTWGADFRQTISATNDIFTISPSGMKLYQRDTHQWYFHLCMMIYFLNLYHFAINIMRFTCIISLWEKNVRTFPTTTRIVLNYMGSVKLSVREYQGKFCKHIFVIRKNHIDYNKYSDLIYAAHICLQ